MCPLCECARALRTCTCAVHTLKHTHLTLLLTGKQERYAGTEFSQNDLIAKAKVDVICAREQVRKQCYIAKSVLQQLRINPDIR